MPHAYAQPSPADNPRSLFKIIFGATTGRPRAYKEAAPRKADARPKKGNKKMTDAPPPPPEPGQIEFIVALLEHIRKDGAFARFLRGAAHHNIALASPDQIAGDVLHGASEIAVYLYGDKKYRRRIYNLIEAGRLPHFRLGATICGRKSILLSWVAAQERSFEA
jgi:hypothetical protein